MERLADADVLRVLELSLNGLKNKQIAQQTQLDAFAVQRVVYGRKNKAMHQLIAKYPAWRAKHEHLLHLLNPGAASKSGNPVSEYETKRLERMRGNQAALAALGIEKFATRKRASTNIYAVKKAEAQRLLLETARKNPRRSARLLSLAPELAPSASQGEWQETSPDSKLKHQRTRRSR